MKPPRVGAGDIDLNVEVSIRKTTWHPVCPLDDGNGRRIEELLNAKL